MGLNRIEQVSLSEEENLDTDTRREDSAMWRERLREKTAVSGWRQRSEYPLQTRGHVATGSWET